MTRNANASKVGPRLHDVGVAQRLQDADLVAEARLLLGRVPAHKLHRHGRAALQHALVHLRAVDISLKWCYLSGSSPELQPR